MSLFLNRTTGSIAADAATVTHGLRLLGPAEVAIQIAGTFEGTLQLEATVDGTTFVAFNFSDAGSASLATSATAPKLFVANPRALHSVRVRASAWTSGTATITITSVGG